jgi:hypothetical protein
MTELDQNIKNQKETGESIIEGIIEIIPSRWELLARNADIPWESIIPSPWEYDDAVAFENSLSSHKRSFRYKNLCGSADI